MSEEHKKKLQEARRIADSNGGFAGAVAHLYPKIRSAK